MPRWEPNGRERLTNAALELFLEQGYEATTVAEIAERAGLNKSTFFRHFPDKREVLFAGQDVLCRLFAEGIAAAPAAAAPLDAVAEGLAAAEPAFTADRHGFAPRRRAVVAANPELQEREALKRIASAAAMAAALQARGVPEPQATIAAGLGVLAFSRAYARWAESAEARPFGEVARETLHELRAANAALV
jgi:AcrR family transcriptional regulator